MLIQKKCCVCGKVHDINVPTDGYFKWRNGKVGIQYAMPDVSAEDREMLISDICPKCFDELFKED